MVGISAKDLPYEGLHVGDVIEYYSQAFVCGDRRGHRVTTVLSIDQLEEYPVTIATEEILTLSTLIKRVRDSAGMSVEGSKWRKLRSFTMFNGNISFPTDRERLGERMTTIVTEVIGSIRRSGAASDSPDPLIEDHSSAACSLTRTCSSFHQDGSTATRKGLEDPQTRSPTEAVDESKVVDEGEGTWKISERMCFATGQLAVQAVKAFAFHQGKSMVITRRSGMDRKLKCSSEHCTYTVQIYRKRNTGGTYGEWYISWIRGEHINCVSTPKPTKKLLSDNPTFQSAVNAAPKIAANTLVSMMISRESVSLQAHKRTVYRARDIVNGTASDSINKSYVYIQSYLDQFADLNPGSIAVLERDHRNHFKRVLISVKVITDSMEANQRVLGIDCAHSKCPWYDGVQMTLVGQDGNRETAILAFALVPSEDLENYDWFIKRLIDGGFNFKTHVMFCDRDRSILSVANNLEINVRFCTLHIIRNVTTRFKNFTKEHHNMVWRLQAVETVDAYKSQLGCIELALGVAVRNYLEGIPPVKWCVYANIGIWPLYGWRTSNFVESQFGSQLAMGMRDLPPLQFIQAMCSRLMDRCYRRHDNCERWQKKGMTVTPKSMKLYHTQSKDIGAYRVRHASPHTSYVYRDNGILSMKVQHRVNLAENHCTCAFIDQHRIPCRHMIAVLHSKGTIDTVFQYFDKVYKVTSYAEAFLNKVVHLPLDQDLVDDGFTKHPVP